MVLLSDRRIRESVARTASEFRADVAANPGPAIIRGLAKDWPLVKSTEQGPAEVARYLAQFDLGIPVNTMRLDPVDGGRFFYAPDMRGFNFTSFKVPLGALLQHLIDHVDNDSVPTLYAGSAPTADHLPGFAEANPMPLTIDGASPRIWIGNATHISAHFDASENIAIVAMGRRRFTLFPPDQTPNLYSGPLDVTIAGQPVSMVDLRSPDLERFPRFADAIAAAQVSDLEPGDAIYIPALWWHNVVAESPVNILVNYWYGNVGDGSAFAALIHAIQAIRDLSSPERAAWRVWFDTYVFADDAVSRGDHLPPHARGVLGETSAKRTHAILAYLRAVLR